MSGTPEPSRWDFTDAWLLTAMGGFRRRGRSLSKLIAVADAMNHDVPTEAQAARSLGRLIASGLAGIRGSRYRLTPSGRAVYRKRRGGWFDQANTVLHALKSSAAERWPAHLCARGVSVGL
jgi:hypothetical protein